ncbi:type II toxin-antitoxin system ParD family antitoxin [Spirulina major CS-329]|nr:type II toxin-antitoxin system ParD family antitoxin [Spirulina subsalsa]MDB9504813.1 type II toxin-antitoxin system ParD family antitoxin [Spirulina major CS-329]
MAFVLTPDQEQFSPSKFSGGKYGSAAEVIAAVLRLKATLRQLKQNR